MTDVETVSSVELARYCGKWYEIARLPTRFEAGCTDVTATYTSLGGNAVRVENRCRRGGKSKNIVGKARVLDGTGAKLKVTFFWPFSAPYWVLALGHEYEYAMVGGPGRNYLWILSRTPAMDGAVYSSLVEQARAMGFAVENLERTAHG
jgi:apolipoprotein D and lipocalin family protein